MKVFFSCFGLYQLFIALILAEINYQSDSKILILSDTINSVDGLAERLKALAVWEEVIVIRERGRSVAEVDRQVRSLKIDEADIFHFFSYGMLSSRLLFNSINAGTNIILTEEGRMSYKPLGEYGKWRSWMKLNNIYFETEAEDNQIAWERIDAIQLLEPRLFDGSLKKQPQKIDLAAIFNEKKVFQEFIERLNYVFAYQYQNTAVNVIYFDNSPSAMGILTLDGEKYFLQKVMSVIKDRQYCIKTHPAAETGMREIRFEGLRPKFFEPSNVPWEVVYLNLLRHRDDQKLVLLTPASTAAHNSFIIGDLFGSRNCYLILLTQLIRDYLAIDIFEEDFQYYQRFIALYGKDKIFLPESFTEFEAVFTRLFGGVTLKNRKFAEHYLAELKQEGDWLKKHYVETYQYLPDYVGQSALVLDRGAGYDWNQSLKQWLDTQKSDFKLNFSNPSAGIVRKVLWIPYRGRVLGRVKVEEVKVTAAEKRELTITDRDLRTNGRVDADGYINFDFREPYLEFDLNQEIDEFRIRGKFFFEDTYQMIVKQSGEELTSRPDDNALRNERLIAGRLNEYYRLLNNWLRLRQNNRKISRYFLQNNYRKLAIYGFGELGKNLLGELKDSPIKVVCMVNQNRDGDFETGIALFDIAEFSQRQELADAVVVTPVYDFEVIKNALLAKKVGIPIVSLKTVIVEVGMDEAKSAPNV